MDFNILKKYCTIRCQIAMGSKLFMRKKEITITPFLKWAGGKRWFVHKYNKLLPEKYNRFYYYHLCYKQIANALMPLPYCSGP
jgi:hypothetical protein